MTTAGELVRLLAGVLALLAVTGVVLRVGGVRLGAAPYTAVARGALQLAVVGLALRGVLTRPVAVVGVLLLMLCVAVLTSSSRLSGLERPRPAVALACTTGAVTALVVVFGLTVLPLQARYVIALGGIVIGNTMTATTLAGRRLLDGLRARRDEVEAWLSLGATPREAVADIARTAAGEALLPGVDQTRTTGLVTLPGAFIGALLGGADPTQAARFQLVVLVAILAAQSVAAVLLVRLLGAPSQLPEAPGTVL